MVEYRWEFKLFQSDYLWRQFRKRVQKRDLYLVWQDQFQNHAVERHRSAIAVSLHGASRVGSGQGKASYFVDLGLSKDIFHGNGTLTLSVRDLFNTHKHENETFGDGFYSNSYFQFHRRAITLGLNYRLKQEKEEERERNGDEPNGIEF